MRILLIASPDDFALRFAARLQQEGATVTSVATGVDGVFAAKGSTFDLILLDLELPDMDGLEALSHLHSGEALATPVYLLKGEGEPAHVLQRGLDFGAKGYIIKHRLPGDLGAVPVLANLTNGLGRQDACPFSSRHEFGRCTVFMPLGVSPTAVEGEPSVTCSHLRVGTSDTWRLYPRCAIGDQVARDRYLAKRTPA